MILCSRIFELYVFTFFIENLILMPAIIRYWTVAGMRLPSFFGGLALCVLLPLFSVGVCCLLGWALAWLGKKMPDNHIVAIVFSFAFIGAYFWASSQINTWISYILANPTEVQGVLQSKLYPFWQMGLAAEGNLLSLLIFAVMVAAVFALIYFGISKTYISFLTVKTSRKQTIVKQKATNARSLRMALLQKEFRRFFKSYGYLMNSGIGTVMMLGVSIYSLFEGSFMGLNADMVAAFGFSGDKVVYVVALLLCVLSATNFITAPSISLEGETIWILQTMPVSAWDIFLAKLLLHGIWTLPAVLFCGVVASVLLQAGALSILAIVLGCIYVLFTAVFGLIINLKFPDLHWTNETVAVKQGISSLLSMLCGMAMVFVWVGGYFLFGQYLQTWLYLAICVGILTIVTILGVRWLQKRGAEIFRSLS
jgi:ABC-2 type transport system permease protein